MELRNTDTHYGIVQVLMHWLVAIAVFGLFALGYYMVDLGYYDAWYRTAPHIHKSVGLLLLALMVARLAWRWVSSAPTPQASHKRWEIVLAHLAHIILYLLIFTVLVSGYLISTADGSSIMVFNWFEVPSVTGQVKQLEDVAGKVHYWCAWALVGLAGVHGLAAIKHHVIDRDETLRRMLGLSAR
ncbi:cytochrome b [Marinobacter zhejiangensis]|uniref:Cytochrome b561 n=1 Tax=Marinobacter zhejiangensis TaxID=488535 RepID=A0A1I4QGN3_9GAMM|nr:cytochrome b [Marinobacter zhejiangensis]SFM39261.1 cytochrome b561 [Marinobacter zhejiangensis]